MQVIIFLFLQEQLNNKLSGDIGKKDKILNNFTKSSLFVQNSNKQSSNKSEIVLNLKNCKITLLFIEEQCFLAKENPDSPLNFITKKYYLYRILKFSLHAYNTQLPARTALKIFGLTEHTSSVQHGKDFWSWGVTTFQKILNLLVFAHFGRYLGPFVSFNLSSQGVSFSHVQLYSLTDSNCNNSQGLLTSAWLYPFTKEKKPKYSTITLDELDEKELSLGRIVFSRFPKIEINPENSRYLSIYPLNTRQRRLSKIFLDSLHKILSIGVVTNLTKHNFDDITRDTKFSFPPKRPFERISKEVVLNAHDTFSKNAQLWNDYLLTNIENCKIWMDENFSESRDENF